MKSTTTRPTSGHSLDVMQLAAVGGGFSLEEYQDYIGESALQGGERAFKDADRNWDRGNYVRATIGYGVSGLGMFAGEGKGFVGYPARELGRAWERLGGSMR